VQCRGNGGARRSLDAARPVACGHPRDQDGHAASFGIDIIPRFATVEHIEICAAERVGVVVFFWDEPAREWLSCLRDAGCRIWVQVGSVEEGEAALRAGADALIAQGSEAGGHNRAVAATFSLLPALADAAADIPVIAAGGIADGGGLAAALALGADAAWIGTRFLGASGRSPAKKLSMVKRRTRAHGRCRALHLE
jgi:enoyl-[acyl-carrier protein] reductase II